VQCLYNLFAVLIFVLLVVYENLGADKVEEGEKLLQVVLKRSSRDQ
jgi:hypothetical protein